jgi:hypothetical protein
MTETKGIPGILAIWNSCAPGSEGDFEEWYQHEHFFERIGVPGFLHGRRYEAVRGTPPYFCIYLTQSPAVLKSPAYIERLNNPTPQTRKIMSGPFRDMVRTVCGLTARYGAMRGSVAVTARFTKAQAQDALEKVAKEPGGLSGVGRGAAAWRRRPDRSMPYGRDAARRRRGDGRGVTVAAISRRRDRYLSPALRDQTGLAQAGLAPA